MDLRFRGPGDDNLINEGTNDSRLLPRWFAFWFYISCLLLFVGGISDEIAGKEVEGMNAWGASISIFIMVLLVLFLWNKRDRVRSLASRIHLPLVMKSVMIGVLFAEIDELVCFPFNPLFSGVTLLEDIILTVPMYFFAHLFWYWVLRKYAFTVREALLTGGLSLGLVEVIFGGTGVMALLGIFILPFIILMHGVHMVMPKLALFDEFAAVGKTETRLKYLAGVLMPIAGTIIGIGAAFLVAAVFNLA
ncbi:MAG TPA: hypothetical protein VMX56_10240 [Anaerolineales bacterium]|nr:hypothetical protein [Anaerolineales bacterium]